jgi:hypothetical protein
MEMQELEITIDKNGSVHMAVRGIHGERCIALTKNIENAIGTVETREYTSEYYEQLGQVSGNQHTSQR